MATKTCIYYITLQCNDACEFCSIWDNKDYKAINEASIECHLDNLNIAKREGAAILDITGGEPLLYDKLPLFLEKAKSLNLNTTLTTNGILYKERSKEIKGLAGKIYFSLDYPVQDEHDRSRGVECFNDVIRAITHAKDLGENPAILFTITRDSVRFLPEITDLSEKLKVKIYAHAVYDYFGISGFEKETYDCIKYYFNRNNMVINLAELEFLKDHGNKTVWPRCKARETTITFLPDGSRATPCFFNNGGREGRESICYGCARYPYMIPSFGKGLDKYYLFNWYTKVKKGEVT